MPVAAFILQRIAAKQPRSLVWGVWPLAPEAGRPRHCEASRWPLLAQAMETRDSPRDNFELGETMGGVVIRIPLKD